jgi:hypothetical protein
MFFQYKMAISNKKKAANFENTSKEILLFIITLLIFTIIKIELFL